MGATLSRSGLSRRTALGGTALVLGANLPDLDVLAYLAGPAADLEWRRGWSHGVLALAILPFVLAGGLVLLDRLTRGARRDVNPAELVPKQLLLLSSIAILSHPALDALNTYGVRWLMPFSGRWYYGDVLFIVDPWVWLALGAGVLRSGQRPARWALVLVAFYMGSMWISGSIASRIIAREIEALSGKPVRQVMAGPVPLNIFARNFVAKQDTEFRVGGFHWLTRPHVNLSEVSSFPRGRPTQRAFAVAESSLVMRRFLGWARFPTFVVEETGTNQYLVHAVDLRYARRPGDNFGTVSIPVRLRSASVPARLNELGSRSPVFLEGEGMDMLVSFTYCIQNTAYTGPS